MTNDKILSDFGRNISKRRLKLGISQERLAELAQLDRTYISSTERGKRNVSLINICKLAAALGCTPDDLLKDLGGLHE